MKYAWQIFKSTKATWQECMIKAWQLYRLTKAMRQGIVKFYYRKSDGSIRLANGTILHDGLSVKKSTGKPSYRTFCYFDVDKHQYRCFRVENLICTI